MISSRRLLLDGRAWSLASALVTLAALASCGDAASNETPPSAVETTAAATHAFDDCSGASWCPAMIGLPRGSFMMGSLKSERGRFEDEDQHQVTVGAFAIGRAPVTRGEWAQFVNDTGRATPQQPCAYAPGKNPTWKNPGFPQDDNHPVVCITWDEAHAYAAWLSKRTGHRYRLPTDEEWEYAARAGTTTAFPWGPTASHAFANYGLDECCGPATGGRDRWEYTSPVGSFPPNPFGLVDMHGNVFEWVETCADAFEKLPLPKHPTGCTFRYARGGVYADRPEVMRSAAKNIAPPPDDSMTIRNYRSAGFGFRVVRDV
jgi:formylglycine-generating enzyme required for sulfatase activity